jgi:hypothetical protein
MRTGLTGASCSSDIVQIDPNNGTLLSRFKCEPGETARCIQIAKIGSEQVLIVGTSKSNDHPMMPNGEAERSICHLFLLIKQMLSCHISLILSNIYPSSCNCGVSYYLSVYLWHVCLLTPFCMIFIVVHELHTILM